MGAELSFQLPMNASAAFPELFARLEADSVPLGIETYGISVTTLEEVFMKVAEIGTAEEQQKQRHLSRQLSTMRQASNDDKISTATKAAVSEDYRRDVAITGHAFFTVSPRRRVCTSMG